MNGKAEAALTYLGPATPYFYIGDSHAGAIGNHVFKPSHDAELIATALISIWRFVARDMLDADLMIGDSLMQALRRTGAFHSSPDFQPLPGLRPVRTTYHSEQVTEFLAVTSAAAERPYVLYVGEINCRYILHLMVTDGIDFAVPFPVDGLNQLPPHSGERIFSTDQILTLLLEVFEPLIRALKTLKSAGMNTLFLHSLPPPAVNDDDAERVLKYRSPARLRYKLTMFVNFLYRSVCKELGIGFIDMWPQVTDNDVLDQRFYLDGLHLNAEHSKLSVAEVHRQMTALRAQVAPRG